jgi:hypothetical protein
VLLQEVWCLADVAALRQVEGLVYAHFSAGQAAHACLAVALVCEPRAHRQQ